MPGSLDPQNANRLVQFSQVNATTPGFVSVQFSGVAIPDLPGDDITLYLVDWNPLRNQIFEVFASVDGTTYVSLGESGPPTGDEVAGGFPSTISFDLAVGLLGFACGRRGAR